MIAPIRVLVVDDSPSVCRLLTARLTAADVRVVATATSGERAVELAAECRPDVITLDLDMPGLGGLGALERVMAARPTPVVLLSGAGRKAAAATAAGLRLGAVDFIPKYTPGRTTDPTELADALLAKVRAAARVKVIRAIPAAAANDTPPPDPGRVIVVGASTGGPAAVRTLLGGLPAAGRPAVVVVQHLPPAWSAPLAALLARHLRTDVRPAADGDRPRPGEVLVAPGDRHLTFRPDGTVSLNDAPKRNGYRPSIDVTFESAAEVYGGRAVGVLLTGMGEDGARGLLALRRAGGRTFAQSGPSCVVFGMPGKAIELDAAEEIDTPAGIAARLATRLAGV